MEMGEKFVENDFFKDYGQKWKVRNGTVVFQKMFLSSLQSIDYNKMQLLLMLQFVASLQKWKVGSRQNDHGGHVIELFIDGRKKMILTELSEAYCSD